MANISTTTKIIAASVVAGGVVYLFTRDAKAKASDKKTTTKTTTTGELPGVGDLPGGGGAPDDLDYTVPPYPEEGSSSEKANVDQVYGEWVATEAEANAAAIKNGSLGYDWLMNDLTDRAFNTNYPTWATGEGVFPRLSPQWVSWNAAWKRMNEQMIPLVSATLSTYGI